ncbi:hypothetical protein [Streptomyces sioyaensis]
MDLSPKALVLELGALEVHPMSDVRQVLQLALAPASDGAAPEVPIAA